MISNTTTYISGGKLGDFIQQMSIIYEKYLLDGKLAVLYISDRGDIFQHGVQTAYEDLSPIVSRQTYIKEFKIHNGEPYDIDLSSWRRHSNCMFADTYTDWMKKEYNVEWGKHKWLLNTPFDPVWKDTIVINTTRTRFPTTIDWKNLLDQYGVGNTMFVGFEQNDHNHFSRIVKMVPYHRPHSLEELCVILNSCRLFIGSLSSPLSIAFGLHTPIKIGLYNNRFDFPAFHNIGENIPSFQYYNHIIEEEMTTYSQAGQDLLVVLLTDGKKGGWYVEIGANHPIKTSNTYLLEKKYQWKGVMVEWDHNFLSLYKTERPLAFHFIGDATKYQYEDILEEKKFPLQIDYLQIDLDVENRSTLTTLEMFDKNVFKKYIFGIVTFEHDIYRGDFFNTQEKSRKIFQKHGYIRIFSNVAVFFEKKWCVFEDWYAHPHIIDPDLINNIIQHPENKDTIGNVKCIQIIQSIKNQSSF